MGGRGTRGGSDGIILLSVLITFLVSVCSLVVDPIQYPAAAADDAAAIAAAMPLADMVDKGKTAVTRG